MNLFTKQKQTYKHRKQIYGYQKGKDKGSNKLGIWNQQIHTAIYKVNSKDLCIAQRTIFNIL